MKILEAGFVGQSPTSASFKEQTLQNMWFVYILKCSDNKIYTGCTSDVDDRLKRHNSGTVPATKARLPVVLVTYIAFTDKYKAFAFEKYEFLPVTPAERECLSAG